MRVTPTVKLDIDTEYDPETASNVPEIIEHEKRGLEDGHFEPYIITVYLGSEEIHSVGGYVASSGYVGEYDNASEIGDSFLQQSAKDLVEEANNMAEVVSFYIVASSAASARWAWEANLKNGSYAIMSDDKDFAETEARYESMRWRMRKSKDPNTPDHYRPYEFTLIIKEA
jgi:hypothetical protein